MRKTLSALLAVLFALSVGLYALADNSDITVTVDDSKVEFDQQPVIEDGRTLVPVRAIFEALGATVEWDADTRTVSAELGDTSISLAIDSDQLYVNDEATTIDVPARIIGDRTMVPVRAISESFGCYVQWVGETRTVVILSDEYQEQLLSSAKNYEFVTEDKDVYANDGDDLIMSISVKYPVFSGDNIVITYANTLTANYLEAFINTISNEYEEDALTKLASEGDDFTPLAISVKVDPTYISAQYVSVCVSVSIDDVTVLYGITYDINAFEETDILSMYDVTEDDIANMITDYVSNYPEDADVALYDDALTDLSDNIDSLSDYIGYYLVSADDFVIYINPGLISDSVITINFSSASNGSSASDKNSTEAA